MIKARHTTARLKQIPRQERGFGKIKECGLRVTMEGKAVIKRSGSIKGKKDNLAKPQKCGFQIRPRFWPNCLIMLFLGCFIQHEILSHWKREAV